MGLSSRGKKVVGPTGSPYSLLVGSERLVEVFDIRQLFLISSQHVIFNVQLSSDGLMVFLFCLSRVQIQMPLWIIKVVLI